MQPVLRYQLYKDTMHTQHTQLLNNILPIPDMTINPEQEKRGHRPMSTFTQASSGNLHHIHYA
jgi:hypothetical protein